MNDVCICGHAEYEHNFSRQDVRVRTDCKMCACNEWEFYKNMDYAEWEKYKVDNEITSDWKKSLGLK